LDIVPGVGIRGTELRMLRSGGRAGSAVESWAGGEWRAGDLALSYWGDVMVGSSR
jgi:hypothetical protein